MRWVHEPSPGIDVAWFDSPRDLMEAPVGKANRAKFYRKRLGTSYFLDPDDYDMGDVTWSGTRGGMAAVMDAMTGRAAWPEGETHWANAMAQIKAKPLPKIESVRRRRRRGEEGAEIDADRMYAGDFDSMWIRTQREASRARRHLRILINVGGNASVPARDMIWSGVVGALLVELLRKSGRNCEVHAFTVAMGSFVDGTDVATVVKIKDATQRLDVRSLLAWAAMPGSFRSAMFHGRASHPTRKLRGALGRNTTTTDTGYLLRRIDPTASADASIVVPKLKTRDEAQAWLAREWERLRKGGRR